MIRTSLALAALLLLTACAGSRAGDSAPDLAGEWELVEGVADGAALPMPTGSRATLRFEDGTLAGRSFCNHYSGSYEADDGGLHIAGLGGTEMGCEPAVMDAESRYLAALAAATSIARESGELRLTGDDVELRFRTLPPVPTSDLVGTRWVLDTLIDGEAASSTLGGAALELRAEGRASGSTGCKGFLGTWQRTADVLTLVLDRDDVGCPGDLGRQDVHVLAVLDTGPTVAIDGARLTLIAPDGRGLSYRAG